VLVVEHDEDMIRAADHVIDMGLGAGVHGGRVIAQGTFEAGAGRPRIADRPLPGGARCALPTRALQSAAAHGWRRGQPTRRCCHRGRSGNNLKA
jgi:hypothetical protein